MSKEKNQNTHREALWKEALKHQDEWYTPHHNDDSKKPVQRKPKGIRNQARMLETLSRSSENKKPKGNTSRKPKSEIESNLQILVVKGKITDVPVALRGESPYTVNQLNTLVKRMGGIPYTSGTSFNKLIIVIGRSGFNENFLKNHTGPIIRNKVKFLSQEDFITYASSGDLKEYTKGDPRLTDHPGLAYLASIKFDWPSTFTLIGQAQLDPFAHFDQESILKHQYGYSVRKGSSLSQRREALKRAIEDGVELEFIVRHITKMMKLRKGRYSMFFEAIVNWEEDLQWLKEHYYKPPYYFIWPKF